MSDTDATDFTEEEINEIMKDDSFTEIFCYCCTPADDNMIQCSSKICEMEWFHMECVGIPVDNEPPNNWICDECKPQKQIKGKKVKRSKESSVQKPVQESKSKINHTSSKPKKISKEKPTFSQENAESSAVELFTEAIKESMKNPMALINESILQDLQAILPTITSAEINDSFIHSIVLMVWQVQSTATTKVTTDALDKMCGDFHKLRTDDNVIEQFENYLQLNGLLKDHSLLTIQCILESLLRIIISKACDSSDLVFDIPDEELSSCKLSEQEELALRYTAGYIAQSLSKHYRKRKEKNKVADAYFNVLTKWNESAEKPESPTFLSYTKKLVNMANRGGLFCIKDAVFIFFRRMEMIVKPHLQNMKNINNINIKEKIEIKVTESSLVGKISVLYQRKQAAFY